MTKWFLCLLLLVESLSGSGEFKKNTSSDLDLSASRLSFVLCIRFIQISQTNTNTYGMCSVHLGFHEVSTATKALFTFHRFSLSSRKVNPLWELEVLRRNWIFIQLWKEKEELM